MTAETPPNGDRITGAYGNCLPSMDIPVCLGQILLADAVTLDWINYFGLPMRVIRVETTIAVVPATGDSTISIKNAAAETIGTVVITESGSAVGDVDSSGVIPQTYTYSPIIADEEALYICPDATPSAGEAQVTVWFRPCIDGVS